MLIQCSLLLLALNCVGTTKHTLDYGNYDDSAVLVQKYSDWPSVRNAVNLMRLRKREAQAAPPVQPLGQSEGGTLVPQVNNTKTNAVPENASVIIPPVQSETKNEQGDVKQKSDVKVPEQTPAPVPSSSSNIAATVSLGNITETNSTNTTNSEGAVNVLNINNPGVVKRASIVFGGFLLLAVAYFIFYRKKRDKNNANANGMADANQFRYGVLESEDRRSNMELSRVPLTMESDDDEDDDLEIFDLGQKNSQSYVNLPAKDEDLVFNSTEKSNDDKDTLLLEIEDGPSDTLINWSNNGNKSIL